MTYDEQAMEALKNRRRDDPKDDAIVLFVVITENEPESSFVFGYVFLHV